MLQQSSFCAIPSSQTPSFFTHSLKQRNPLLRHQQFPLYFPRNPKAPTFKVYSLSAGFFNDIAQIAQNKVPIWRFTVNLSFQILGFSQVFIFFSFFYIVLLFYMLNWHLFCWCGKVLIAAGVSMAIGQLSKPFSSVFLYGKEFDIKTVVQAGGFPSSHSSVWLCNP